MGRIPKKTQTNTTSVHLLGGKSPLIIVLCFWKIQKNTYNSYIIIICKLYVMYYSITLCFNDKNSPRYFESKCQFSEKNKRRVTKKQPEKGTLVADFYISFNHLQLSWLQPGALLVINGVTGPYKWSYKWATGVINPMWRYISTYNWYTFTLYGGRKKLCKHKSCAPKTTACVKWEYPSSVLGKLLWSAEFPSSTTYPKNAHDPCS